MSAPTPRRLQRPALCRKAPTAATLPAVIEEAVQARAHGRCEFCMRALGNRCRRHHRKIRSQGGLDQVANVVVVHFNCHNTIHANPQWSYENGWLVKSHRNPASIPIELYIAAGEPWQRRMTLTKDGRYEAA